MWWERGVGIDDRIIDEVGRGAGLTLAFRSGHLDRDSYDIAGLIRLGVLLQLNVYRSRVYISSPRSPLYVNRGVHWDCP